jgi:hypothetical protein
MSRRIGLLLALGLASACGDISSVSLDVVFPDPTPEDGEPPPLQVATRSLWVIVRTVPENPALACVGFESGQRPGGVSAADVIVPYPVEDPLLALGIDPSVYDALTFIVLAFSEAAEELDVQAATPIAGACDNLAIDTDERIPVRVILDPL